MANAVAPEPDRSLLPPDVPRSVSVTWKAESLATSSSYPSWLPSQDQYPNDPAPDSKLSRKAVPHDPAGEFTWKSAVPLTRNPRLEGARGINRTAPATVTAGLNADSPNAGFGSITAIPPSAFTPVA